MTGLNDPDITQNLRFIGMSKHHMKVPTLTSEGCRSRQKKLIRSVDADLFVIVNPRNIFYYTGFLTPFPSQSEWGPVYLLIEGGSGHSTLICHNFAAKQAKNVYADRLESWTWYNASTDPGVELYATGARKLHDFITSIDRVRSMAVEAGWFPFISGIDQIEVRDITPEISSQQRCKDPDEITCIRYVLDSALAGHEAARNEIRAGMTELDLFSLIHGAMTAQAGRPVKLIGDILSGSRTLAIAGGPTDKRIESGDTVILDLSPVIGGYRADYTTTLVVDREPGVRLSALESALHAAMDAGKEQLLPGRSGSQVYAAVKNSLDGTEFGAYFNNHAGHGLGLGHPEAPYFVPGSDEKLMAGDVVTLEPGAYTDGCAGRIEHIFLITENGPEQLTRHNTAFAL